jgi:isomerase DpgB
MVSAFEAERAFADNGVDQDAITGPVTLALRLDGSQPLTIEAINAVRVICDTAESRGTEGVLPVHVSGAPSGRGADDIDVALVTKWERVLRRLERLGMTTVALASGDCGGLALDALLATDLCFATPDTRLLVSVADGATWPGMAVYRLVSQAGVAGTRRAVLFGDPIALREAVLLGLVDEVTDDPAAALTSLAEGLAAFSGKDLGIRRQLMLNAAAASFEDALGSHLAACDRSLRQAASARAT